MIGPFLKSLALKKIVLASLSPRRKEILEKIGLAIDVVPSNFKENLQPESFPCPSAFVVETAKQKALDVFHNMIKKKVDTPNLIISADTVVVIENRIIGKPKNDEEAFAILESLSGKTHSVLTGVVLLYRTSETDPNAHGIKTFCEETKVRMGTLTKDIINDYIHSEEPMDKAGAYGIQGYGGSLVEAIEGDFYNVVGFPMHKFCKELYFMCQDKLF